MKQAVRRLLNGLPLAVLLGKLAVLLVNLRTMPTLQGAPARAGEGEGGRHWRVSLLVPARNEAHNLRTTLPALLAQGAHEVLVLDDHSTDHTARLARDLGATVIPGRPLPPGWHGKTWACQQLARHASGDILIFTDADVTWHPGALPALLDELQRSGAHLLSVFPQQHNQTWGERLLTPLVDDALLCNLPAPLLRLPHPAASAANGQVMAFHRAFYQRMGGHACVKNAILEDVQLAREVKRAGGRVALALGHERISVRMYRSYRDSVQGISKTVLPFHGGQRALLLPSFALHVLVYTLPWLRRQPLPMLLSVLIGLLVRLKTGRTRPADLLEVLLTPAIAPASLPTYLRALRRTTTWKGRAYEQ